MADSSGPMDMTAPRKPERENGKRRYAMLLAATEMLLSRDGVEALTIQNIAKEAGVPMASVYHFFPSPTAACVAVAETYLRDFEETIRREIPNREKLNWREIIATFMQRAVEYYRQHCYAQRLMLGSEFSWHVRQADIENNRMLAALIYDQVADQFPGADEQELLAALRIAISIGDAVWALSIAEHDVITKQYAEDAWVAECGYIAAKFPQNRPM